MGHGARRARQPTAVDDAGAHRNRIEYWALSLPELAIHRALHGDRAAQRRVCSGDAMDMTVALAPDAYEGHVDVEPAQRDLMHALVDLGCRASDALLERAVVDGVTVGASVFVEFIRQLQHGFESKYQRRQVRSLLNPNVIHRALPFEKGTSGVQTKIPCAALATASSIPSDAATPAHGKLADNIQSAQNGA